MEQTTFAALLSLMDTWITDPKCGEKPRVIHAKSCIEKYPHMEPQQIDGLKMLITSKKPNPEDIIAFCTSIGYRYFGAPPAGVADAAKGPPAGLPRVPVKAAKDPVAPVPPRVPVSGAKGPPAGHTGVPATAAKAPAVPLFARTRELFTSLLAMFASLWRTVAAFVASTWKTVAAFVASTWKMCVDQGHASWVKVKDGDVKHTVQCISLILLGMAALFFAWFFMSTIVGYVISCVCQCFKASGVVLGKVLESFGGFAVVCAQRLIDFCESGYKFLYEGFAGIPGVFGRVWDAYVLSPAVAFMQLFQRTANASSFATGGSVPIEGIAVNTSSLATGQCQCQGADRGDFVNSTELGNLRAMVDQLALKLQDYEFVNHTPPQQLGSANASNFTVGTDLEVTRAVPQGWDSTIQNLENRLAACEQGNTRQDAQIAGLEVSVSNFSVELEKQINVSSILNETILDALNDAHGWFVKFQHIGMIMSLCLLSITWGLTWVQKAPFMAEICRALGYTDEAKDVFESLIGAFMIGGLFCLMAVGLVSMVCWA